MATKKSKLPARIVARIESNVKALQRVTLGDKEYDIVRRSVHPDSEPLYRVIGLRFTNGMKVYVTIEYWKE